MNPAKSLCRALAIGWLAITATGTAAGDEVSPPAREWRGYCRAYVATLEGDTKTSDLDVTYCIGITKGLLSGLRIGSQIGALSFASRLAVQYKLDPDEVFKLFQVQEPTRLLGVCSPADAPAADYVRAVLRYLEQNPAELEQPIGEVFFDGLQAAYPCR